MSGMNTPIKLASNPAEVTVLSLGPSSGAIMIPAEEGVLMTEDWTWEQGPMEFADSSGMERGYEVMRNAAHTWKVSRPSTFIVVDNDVTPLAVFMASRAGPSVKDSVEQIERYIRSDCFQLYGMRVKVV